MDDICYVCDGSGKTDPLEKRDCPECGGTGWSEPFFEEPDYEIVGSCENCGVDVPAYMDDGSGLCEQCQFMAELN